MELEKVAHLWGELHYLKNTYENKKEKLDLSKYHDNNMPVRLTIMMAEYEAENSIKEINIDSIIREVRDLFIRELVNQRNKIEALDGLSVEELKEIVMLVDEDLDQNIEYMWKEMQTDKQCFEKIKDIILGCC